MCIRDSSRSAGAILQDQKSKTTERDDAMLANLEETKQLGLRIKAALEGGDPRAFGEMMDEHWQRKRQRSAGTVSYTHLTLPTIISV